MLCFFHIEEDDEETSQPPFANIQQPLHPTSDDYSAQARYDRKPLELSDSDRGKYEALPSYPKHIPQVKEQISIYAYNV